MSSTDTTSKTPVDKNDDIWVNSTLEYVPVNAEGRLSHTRTIFDVRKSYCIACIGYDF